MLRGKGAVQSGDAMAVRVAARVPQLPRDAFFKAFRNEVLQTLRLIVQIFHGVIQHLEQERFNEPVMAHNFQRTPPPEL